MVGFLGSYFGGCFTLFAFIGSSIQNKETLKKTLEENQRQLKEQLEHSNRQAVFQAEQEKIRRTEELLAEIITSYRPFLINEISSKIDKALTKDASGFSDETTDIILLLNSMLEQFHSNATKIKLNGIMHLDCPVCQNQEICNLGMLKVDFSNKFTEYSNAMFNSVFYLQEYVQELTLFVYSNNAKGASSVDQEFSDTKNKVLEATKHSADLYETGLTTLTMSARFYILELINLSRQRLEGENTLKFIHDPEKQKEFDDLKKQVEKEFANK